MTRYKRIYVSPECHKKARELAAQQGLTIADAIANALGENAKDTEKKVKSYGLFK